MEFESLKIKCDNCSMDYKKKFYERYVSSHTEQIYGSISLKDMRSRFVFNDSYYGGWLPSNKGAKVLDVGCGNGSFVFWLQERGFSNAAGMDISPEQISQGKNLGIKNIEVADFREFLKEHTDTYEIIFARDILEHLSKEEVLEMLELVRIALKPGGSFISQTVNAENPLWGRLRHADFTHDLAFTRESMRQLLLMSGFNAIDIRPQRPVPHGLVSGIRSILWIGIEIVMHLYLAIETGTPGGIFTQNIITKATRHEAA
jgi:2-polyprenyl-3-methyl-5-hydroxy-6-metoxy-1,4-benzoquinol methylase